MRLPELVSTLDLAPLLPQEAGGPTSSAAPAGDAAGDTAGADITRAYASDLLSDVLANAPAGGVLITLQVHLNVIAVAGHAGMAAVIFSSGRRPEDVVITKAAEEGIALYSSPESTFDLAGKLYALGVRGSDT